MYNCHLLLEDFGTLGMLEGMLGLLCLLALLRAPILAWLGRSPIVLSLYPLLTCVGLTAIMVLLYPLLV